MLKIKDNVDLKELEKFGFTKIHSYEDETDIYCIENEEYSGQNIIIFCDDKSILVSGYKILNILYDLIQARISGEGGIKHGYRSNRAK